MKKLASLAVVAAAAAIFPSGAFAAFSGVVVGKGSGSLAVAAKGGAIHTVRTRVHARVGARVRVSGSVVRVIGRAHHVRIHAVIVRRARGTTFLAGDRSLVAVHTGRALASVVDHKPTSGTIVNTTAMVTSAGQLNAGPMQVVGQTTSVTIQAPVLAVGPGSITVGVNGTPLTIALPAGIQLPASLVGQMVTLTINLAGAQPVAREDDDDQGDNDDDQGDDDDPGGDEGGDD
jgi:hypothetical protein